MNQMIGDKYQQAVDQIGYEIMFLYAAEIDSEQLNEMNEAELSDLLSENTDMLNIVQESVEGMSILFSKPFIQVRNDVLEAIGKVDIEEIFEVQRLKQSNRLH